MHSLANRRQAAETNNTLSILIATDNHLGYNEKDVLRCDDTFNTFEEILTIAKELEVDALLLGGDLFHDNRPSRKTLHRTMELLRHYCLGDKPCAMELLSDPSINFPTKFGTVNYEDPNYNVSLPTFIIHGNHDDPAGDGNLSAIDLLATAGFVNYFGKTTTVDDITINPILLKKGETRLAMYGLGAVRDERLHRTFLQRKVTMPRPPDGDEWFNMMILHQNRAAHGPTGYIPEHFLEEFLDLVVWGHEHECQACEPSSCPERGFTVLQPGSSVATSLSEGETRGKHVVILQIRGKSMELIPIPLRTVRPFIMRDVVLREITPKIAVNDTKAISQYLTRQIEEMISIAQSEWEQKQNQLTADLRRPCPLPLIRLRVDYSADLDSEGFASAYAIVNPQRFGQAFTNRIANPRDVVYFVRRRAAQSTIGSLRKDKSTTLVDVPLTGRAESMRVEDLVSQFLSTQKLDLLPQNEFCDVVRVAVEKDDRDAIEGFVKQALDRTLSSLRSREANPMEKEALKAEFERTRKLREDEWHRLHPGLDALLANHRAAPVARSDEEDGSDAEDKSMDVEPSSTKTATTSRGRGRGRGSRGGRAAGATASTRGRGRSAAAASSIAESPAKRGRSNTLDFESMPSETGDGGIPSIPATPIVESATLRTTAIKNKDTTTSQPSASKWPPRRR